MNDKIKFTIPLLLLLVLLAAISYGCTSRNETPADDQSDGQSGRVIVPDTDWEEAQGTNEQPVEEPVQAGGTGSETDGNDSEDNDGSGGAPDHLFYEAGTMTINLFVDGVLQNDEWPLEVFNLTETEVEFRFTADGPPLAEYEIRSAATVDIPQRGELDGQEASVFYKFTYNDGFWEDWGIMVFVRNTQGDSFTKNFKVQPIDLSRFPGSR